MSSLQGTIQSILDRLVAEGKERGVQFAAYLDGELVVDAWAGTMDATSGRAVDGDTLFPVFSVTKGIAATLAHLLVERGHIGYDDPLVDYWPEFGAHGKEGITLRHALSHTAGIPQMPEGLEAADLADWDKMCAAVADLVPLTPPGQEMAYHAITYSWTVGEILRRVDGRDFSTLLAEEVCAPLGIKGMYVGAPPKVDPQVAILEVNPPEAPLSPVSGATPSIPAWVRPLDVWMNTPGARRACMPASSGIMSAKALARHYAALVPGGIDDVELLPPSRIQLATERQWPTDAATASALGPMGLGYGLGTEFSEYGFGHGGHGGSAGFAEPKYGLAVGATRNQLSNHSFLPPILDELKKVLGL